MPNLAPGGDPVLAFALMTSHQDLNNLTREYTRWEKRLGYNFPPLSESYTASAHEVFRWDADIRAEIAITELMQPIRMSRIGGEKDGCFLAAHESKKWPIFQITRPTRDCFEAQVDSVYQHIDLRPERVAEITTQISVPMQYWASILDLNPVDHAFTLEVLSVALAGLSHVNQYAKHTFSCPRPAAYSPSIQPIIKPRRFSAYPSGHAAEAFLVARLLQVMARQSSPKPNIPGARPRADAYSLSTHLQRLAARIADNRVVAGVHFPIDSTAGRIVGESFADYFLFRCGADRIDKETSNPPTWRALQFDATQFFEGAPGSKKFKLSFDAFEPLPNANAPTPNSYFKLMPLSNEPPRRICLGMEVDGGPLGPARATRGEVDDELSTFRTTSVLSALWKRVEAEWQHQTKWNGDGIGE